MMNLVIDAMLRDAPVPVFDLFWGRVHMGEFVDEAEAAMAMWWIARGNCPYVGEDYLFEWISENLELKERVYEQ